MALTLPEVRDVLKRCTQEEILEVCNFKDSEDMVDILDDFLSDNLEDMNQNIEVMGLA